MRFRRPILLFVLALGFFEGAVYNFLPITFPAFERQFGIGLEKLGRLPLMFFVCTILFSLGGGWIIGRLGLRRASMAVLGLAACSFLTIGAAPGLGVLLAGACLLGLAVVGMEVLSAAIITELLGDQRQSNFFVWSIANAVGATAGPVILGEFIRQSATQLSVWRLAYYLSAAAAASFLLWPLLLRSGWRSSPLPEATAPTPASALAVVLRRPAIYALGLAISLHGVAQVGMVSWVGQLYLHRFAIDPAQAAYFISYNSAGFFIGRSVMTWLTRRWKIAELTLLGVCAGGGSLAYIATIAAPGYVSGLVMFALAGVLISGNGPCINSYTGLRFSGYIATAFAVMNGFGSIGSAAGPYLVGLLGDRFGLETGIWFLPIFGLGLSAFAFVWRASDVRRARVPDTRANAQSPRLV